MNSGLDLYVTKKGQNKALDIDVHVIVFAVVINYR